MAPRSRSDRLRQPAGPLRASGASGGCSAPGVEAPEEGAGPTALDPEREAVLDHVGDARLTIVIGESDVGKTTFVRDLVNRFVSRGRRTALVDADIGQSEVGPPTTIGLGRVVRPVTRPADAELIGLRFIGVTSPAREPVATVVGTRRLVDRAFALGFERVVVDTSGLVRGEFGRRLKQAKIDLLAPDVVVALQRDAECEAILRPYGVAARPRIVRAPAVGRARGRTPEDRRRHRERMLAAHLAGARPVTLDLSRVALRTPALLVGAPLDDAVREGAARVIGQEVLWAERRGREAAIVTETGLDEATARALGRFLRVSGLVRHSRDELIGMLAGLDDGALETLGLGVVLALELADRRMVVQTAVGPAAVRSVAIGRERYVTAPSRSGGGH